MNFNRVAMVAGFLALSMAGCSSTPPAQPAAPAVEQKPATPPAPPTPPPAQTKPVVEAPAPDPLNDPNGILAHRSVYFDFDNSSIHSSDASVIEAHGKYLVDHSSRTIRIEGNCDERGSREYNLALGQRRANAVRDRMTAIGVSATRIETISLGKEKPRNSGHNEAAWAENRRADIIYK